MRKWRLRTKGCLQVVHGAIGIGQEKHRRPFRNIDTRRQFAHGQSDGFGLWGVFGNSRAYLLDIRVIGDTIICRSSSDNIDNLVLAPKNRMLFQ